MKKLTSKHINNEDPIKRITKRLTNNPFTQSFRIYTSQTTFVLSFFLGRILNRFSKDVGAMDEILPKTFLEAVQSLLVLIGILAMNCLVSPSIILVIVFLSIAFYYVKTIFLHSAQNIKRLEGISKYLNV